MRVIVTRPAEQAAAWVSRLQAQGIDALALPLINILPVADPEPVRDAWAQLPNTALVMFVSANAVAHFFALRPPGQAWPTGLRAAATGPGTQAALLAMGLTDAQVVSPDASGGRFDAEALWERLASLSWRGQQVLVVRGQDGRDWLAHQWQAAGATVRFVAAYRRAPPRWDPSFSALLQEALHRPAEHVWLFSSSEAATHLQACAPASNWAASGALATHARIAQTVRGLGFGEVRLAAPTLHSVVDAVLAMCHTVRSPKKPQA